MYINYRLHGFNGLSNQNFEDASVPLIQIPASSSSPSVSIGSLRPQNYQKESVKSVQSVVKKSPIHVLQQQH